MTRSSLAPALAGLRSRVGAYLRARLSLGNRLSPAARHASAYTAACALLASFAALALLLVGSGAGRPGDGAAGSLALPDAQQALRYGLRGPGGIAALDPAVVTDADDMQAAQLVFPGLVTLDEQLRPRPWAASRIDVSPDGLTYTFHLRPGLAWSDGAPIDAAAFAYSIDRALHPCTGSLVAYYLYPIRDAAIFNAQGCAPDGSPRPPPGWDAALGSLVGDSLVVRDPRTLAITLQQPVAYFLSALAYPTSYAVPRRLIERYGADWTAHLADGEGLGGNLFVVKAWGRDGRLLLARDDAFWGQKPRLREVEFVPSRDAAAQYDDYLAGGTQVGFAPPERYGEARARPGFAETGLLQIDYFGMNWSWAPFGDARMRRAFALALDKAALARDALGGRAYPTDHLVPSGMPGYQPGLAGPDGSAALGGDPGRARALARGYAKDKCGGDLAKCPGVTLTIPRGDPTVAALARSALAMWRAALPGYPLALAEVDPSALLDGLAARTLQLWYVSWIADYPDPQDWLTNLFLPGARYNDGGVNVPDAARRMLAADVARDPVERMRGYNAAERTLVADVAWIPLDQPKLWWEASPSVAGFALDGRGLSALAVWQRAYLVRRDYV